MVFRNRPWIGSNSFASYKAPGTNYLSGLSQTDTTDGFGDPRGAKSVFRFRRHGWFDGRVPSCDKVISKQRIFVTLPVVANRLGPVGHRDAIVRFFDYAIFRFFDRSIFRSCNCSARLIDFDHVVLGFDLMVATVGLCYS